VDLGEIYPVVHKLMLLGAIKQSSIDHHRKNMCHMMTTHMIVCIDESSSSAAAGLLCREMRHKIINHEMSFHFSILSNNDEMTVTERRMQTKYNNSPYGEEIDSLSFIG
jgi:hypothetical protein